jgi:tubulin polyglutamylase TTLL4
MRLGQFKCLYPNKKTINEYEQYFEYPRYHNKLI